MEEYTSLPSVARGEYGDLYLHLPPSRRLTEALVASIPAEHRRLDGAGRVTVIDWRFTGVALALIRRHFPDLVVTGPPLRLVDELAYLPLAARLHRQQRTARPERAAPIPQPRRRSQPAAVAERRFDLRRKGA